MEAQTIVEKLESLPLKEREAVVTLIDSLAEKMKHDAPASRPKLFGAAKGVVTWMSPDFDEPLEDFKEYM